MKLILKSNKQEFSVFIIVRINVAQLKKHYCQPLMAKNHTCKEHVNAAAQK